MTVDGTVDGASWSVTSPDGTRIGCSTGGAGPPLLLVHGGMCTSQRWAPLWPHLVEDFSVTVMDRRGRASSTDGDQYSFHAEVDDVIAVVEQLAERHGSPVDVFGHSFGALCALAAAARAPALRRLALFEPPGPTTLPPGWLSRAGSMIERGDLGRAMFSFLVEVVGLTAEEVNRLRGSGNGPDPLPILAATLVREAEAIQALDLTSLGRGVTQPVLMLVGSASPPWAAQVTRTLAAHLPHTVVAEIPDHGHEAVDTAAHAVAHRLSAFLRDECGRG